MSVSSTREVQRAARSQSIGSPSRDVVGDRDPRHAADRGLADGRDRARMVNVRAQIPAGVDPEITQLRSGARRVEGQADAIGGRPGDGQRVATSRRDPIGRMGRHLVAAARDRPARGDHAASAQGRGRLPQRVHPRRVHAVVVGQDQDPLASIIGCSGAWPPLA